MKPIEKVIDKGKEIYDRAKGLWTIAQDARRAFRDHHRDEEHRRNPNPVPEFENPFANLPNPGIEEYDPNFGYDLDDYPYNV